MMPGVQPLPFQDEITTIFVVGFPDDMGEREFQNIFTFCPGFEAAALKIPNAIEEDLSNTKKQIIGFAKFRSLEEAMRARDVLSGRKVDAERGSVLKAEMAKKNLHTKRGLSTNTDHGKLQYSNNIPSFRRRSAPESNGLTVDTHYPYQHTFDSQTQFQSDYYSAQPYTDPSSDSTYNDIFDPFAPSHPAIETELNPPISPENFFAPNDTSCLSGDDFDSKLPPLFGSSNYSNRGFSSALYNSDTLLSKSLGSMSMSDFPNSEAFGSRSGSFSYSSNIMHPGADQNPPCNTLYVGNLPNDNCEEELRQLFQCCPGYKRLCFKTRMNGPMCFVEFENVHYATQALFQLYGNYLSSSTKGGIRLSYSKNPLGVRQNISPAAVSSPCYINPQMVDYDAEVTYSESEYKAVH
ncbi:hypothetical protein BC833DRAFT_616340 [Globomyces pollinis-pini]|nr:hypothetical protein BC833DRAFT_616340 [Globomyces pollinis-pini]KAJ2993683.1 hypothetical protein HDV02_002177 [Globomyces sp. JEL0801]